VWLSLRAPLLLYMLSRNLFHSIRRANPTADLRQSWLGGHFGNDSRLLATDPRLDAA
jgi:hypothetical protein